MRISEMLTAIASWLESPENEAILLAEYDEDCLEVVANSCVQAAAILKATAETVEEIEPRFNQKRLDRISELEGKIKELQEKISNSTEEEYPELDSELRWYQDELEYEIDKAYDTLNYDESNITPESIDELANLAEAFDSSNDPELQKQAAVIDELLITIAAPPNAVSERKDLLDSRSKELEKKYKNTGKQLSESNKIADSIKDIEKSNLTKEYTILEAPLSTRYCPDHPGVSLIRIGDGIDQCNLDKKIYNYESGYTLNNGSKVPGGSVSQQTQHLNIPYYSIFDTRGDRLGTT